MITTIKIHEGFDFENFAQKSERSLSEVLSEVLTQKDYNKVGTIVSFMEEHGEITPKEAGLNGYSHLEEYSAKLISPITEGMNCKRQWIMSDCQPYEYEKATYEGTLYMLVNSDTASSGESAVLYARSVKNLVLIGENTMGCNTFGNIASYILTNSGIVCRVPNVVNLCKNPEDCQEGKGFEPDFWVDSTDVEGDVTEWLNGDII